VSTVRKVVAAVLTVGLMAAAMWLYTFKPRLEDRAQHPLMTHGRLGAVVGNPDFSVKVTRVDVASAITKPDFLSKPTVMRSLGIFVIVEAQLKSNKKPFLAGHIRLETPGGVEYGVSGRAAISDSDNEYQPMLWSPARYVFEIPKDRLAGARLIIGSIALQNELSAETNVDLGLGGAKGERLAAHPAASYVLKT
jgi:hypothetical protein